LKLLVFIAEALQFIAGPRKFLGSVDRTVFALPDNRSWIMIRGGALALKKFVEKLTDLKPKNTTNML
jgi:hypothetical protein